MGFFKDRHKPDTGTPVLPREERFSLINEIMDQPCPYFTQAEQVFMKRFKKEAERVPPVDYADFQNLEQARILDVIRGFNNNEGFRGRFLHTNNSFPLWRFYPDTYVHGGPDVAEANRSLGSGVEILGKVANESEKVDIHICMNQTVAVIEIAPPIQKGLSSPARAFLDKSAQAKELLMTDLSTVIRENRKNLVVASDLRVQDDIHYTSHVQTIGVRFGNGSTGLENYLIANKDNSKSAVLAELLNFAVASPGEFRGALQRGDVTEIAGLLWREGANPVSLESYGQKAQLELRAKVEEEGITGVVTDLLVGNKYSLGQNYAVGLPKEYTQLFTLRDSKVVAKLGELGEAKVAVVIELIQRALKEIGRATGNRYSLEDIKVNPSLSDHERNALENLPEAKATLLGAEFAPRIDLMDKVADYDPQMVPKAANALPVEFSKTGREVILLRGVSGCGKSTLLAKMIKDAAAVSTETSPDGGDLIVSQYVPLVSDDPIAVAKHFAQAYAKVADFLEKRSKEEIRSGGVTAILFDNAHDWLTPEVAKALSKLDLKTIRDRIDGLTKSKAAGEGKYGPRFVVAIVSEKKLEGLDVAWTDAGHAFKEVVYAPIPEEVPVLVETRTSKDLSASLSQWVDNYRRIPHPGMTDAMIESKAAAMAARVKELNGIYTRLVREKLDIKKTGTSPAFKEFIEKQPPEIQTFLVNEAFKGFADDLCALSGNYLADVLEKETQVDSRVVAQHVETAIEKMLTHVIGRAKEKKVFDDSRTVATPAVLKPAPVVSPLSENFEDARRLDDADAYRQAKERLTELEQQLPGVDLGTVTDATTLLMTMTREVMGNLGVDAAELAHIVENHKTALRGVEALHASSPEGANAAATVINKNFVENPVVARALEQLRVLLADFRRERGYVSRVEEQARIEAKRLRAQLDALKLLGVQ